MWMVSDNSNYLTNRGRVRYERVSQLGPNWFIQMACRLISVKPLSEPMIIDYLTPVHKFKQKAKF